MAELADTVHQLVAREKGNPPFFHTKCGRTVRDYREQSAFECRVTCLACLATGKFSIDPLLSAKVSCNIEHVSDTRSRNHTNKENMNMAKTPNTTEETETPAEETPAKESKSTKAPLPEGHCTPVQFAKKLSEKRGAEVRPQIIYGYIKNNGPESKNPFPSDKNSDGAVIVNEAKAWEWIGALDARKAERAAAKAAAESKEAEAPAPAES